MGSGRKIEDLLRLGSITATFFTDEDSCKKWNWCKNQFSWKVITSSLICWPGAKSYLSWDQSRSNGIFFFKLDAYNLTTWCCCRWGIYWLQESKAKRRKRYREWEHNVSLNEKKQRKKGIQIRMSYFWTGQKRWKFEEISVTGCFPNQLQLLRIAHPNFLIYRPDPVSLSESIRMHHPDMSE